MKRILIFVNFPRKIYIKNVIFYKGIQKRFFLIDISKVFIIITVIPKFEIFKINKEKGSRT